MLNDNDDAAPNALLAEVLSTGKINASLVIAGDDGIHWRALHEAAKLINGIAQRSRGGEGNFNFAATAMVKPYGPFFPARIIWAAGAPSPWAWRRQRSDRCLRAKSRSG